MESWFRKKKLHESTKSTRKKMIQHGTSLDAFLLGAELGTASKKLSENCIWTRVVGLFLKFCLRKETFHSEFRIS